MNNDNNDNNSNNNNDNDDSNDNDNDNDNRSIVCISLVLRDWFSRPAEVVNEGHYASTTRSTKYQNNIIVKKYEV